MRGEEGWRAASGEEVWQWDEEGLEERREAMGWREGGVQYGALTLSKTREKRVWL